ncbi:diaminopimelate epimerase [Gammaproteobacteria bacterium]|jgi:diaminopimelate epimerase|nr:diaminopimelate epimerase [Gammaproteobacteria bacterium]MDC3301519.1 diaminopimelate epimerase [Gammaproteobacteria bacterium]
MIKFNKMHGNGNDFIVINSLIKDFVLTKGKISNLANRNKGIGFDQLILIEAPTNKEADFFIRFFNSDGTTAKMCLNGIRCAASLIWSEKLSPHKKIHLQTSTRTILCSQKGSLVEAIIQMPSLIEDQDLYKNINKHLNAATYSLVDCGNKHLCIELGSIDTYKLEELYKKLQPEITTKKINLSIYKKAEGEIHIRTYENGAGETLSCGSASASVAFIELYKKNKATILSAGGKLQFSQYKDKLKMIGPAKNVFKGVIEE